MELLYDPDRELTSEEFRSFYPSMGDLPLSAFSDEDLAERYAREYRVCVFDDETQTCVFCKRGDH